MTGKNDRRTQGTDKINNWPRCTQLVMDSGKSRLAFQVQICTHPSPFQTLGLERFLDAMRIKTKNLWHEVQRLAWQFLCLSLSLSPLHTNPGSWHPGPEVLTALVHYLWVSNLSPFIYCNLWIVLQQFLIHVNRLSHQGDDQQTEPFGMGWPGQDSSSLGLFQLCSVFCTPQRLPWFTAEGCFPEQGPLFSTGRRFMVVPSEERGFITKGLWDCVLSSLLSPFAVSFSVHNRAARWSSPKCCSLPRG